MAFCTRCGGQLEEGAVCGCAARADAERAVPKSFFERVKAWPTITRKLLRIITLCIVVVVLFTAVGAAATAPINTVKGYCNAKAAGNWGRVYSYYPFSNYETEFINKDSFVALHKGTKVESYDVADSAGLSFQVAYTQAGPGSLSERVTLVESGARWLFFVGYDVMVSNQIATSYQVTAPRDATVTVDGISLRSGSSQGGNASMDTYEIPLIFTGKHHVQVSHPLCDTMQESVTIQSDGSSSYRVQSLDLSSDTKKELARRAEEVYGMLIDSALQGEEFGEIDLPYMMQGGYVDYLAYGYYNLRSMLYREEGSEGYVSVIPQNYADHSAQLTQGSSWGMYECLLNVDFDTTYTSQEWPSGKWSEWESTISVPVYITFVYEKGDFLIQSMDLIEGYFWQ